MVLRAGDLGLGFRVEHGVFGDVGGTKVAVRRLRLSSLH